jgi:hypothetical protein
MNSVNMLALRLYCFEQSIADDAVMAGTTREEWNDIEYAFCAFCCPLQLSDSSVSHCRV